MRCSSSPSVLSKVAVTSSSTRTAAATIAQLCRRLDGIPLAIELAAARTRMMSPHEIAARLDERFRLLTGGSRTAVERHRTLRQAVDWSYDLLEPREREILDCLGVFAGGFTLDAAEVVASGGDVDPLDVLDGVTQLVDKSLVVADREDHVTRYRLLETIRQYALERLEDRGATDAVRRRHAQWCVQLLASAAAGSRGPDEPEWVARLGRELENLRAAITWSTGVADVDLAVDLLGSVPSLVMNTPLGYAITPWADAVLGVPGASEHPSRGVVLALRAADHRLHDRFIDAERDACEAIGVVSRPKTGSPSFPGGCSSRYTHTRATRTSSSSATTSSSPSFAVAVMTTTSRSPRPCRRQLHGAGSGGRGVEIAEEAMTLAERVGAPSVIGISANALRARNRRARSRTRRVARADLPHQRPQCRCRPRPQPSARIARAHRHECRRRSLGDAFPRRPGPHLRRGRHSAASRAARQLLADPPADRSRRTFSCCSTELSDVTPSILRTRSRSRARRAANWPRRRARRRSLAELAAEGASLDIAGAVGLARQELDRVINAAPTSDA